MPEGYLKIRDSLIAKGKSEEDAKSIAAAIWNKHHKDNPVTRNYEAKHMSRFKLSNKEVGVDQEFGVFGPERVHEFAGGFIHTPEGVREERGVGAHFNRATARYAGLAVAGPVVGAGIGYFIDKARRKKNLRKTLHERVIKDPLMSKGEVLAIKAKQEIQKVEALAAVITDITELSFGSRSVRAAAGAFKTVKFRPRAPIFLKKPGVPAAATPMAPTTPATDWFARAPTRGPLPAPKTAPTFRSSGNIPPPIPPPSAVPPPLPSSIPPPLPPPLPAPPPPVSPGAFGGLSGTVTGPMASTPIPAVKATIPPGTTGWLDQFNKMKRWQQAGIVGGAGAFAGAGAVGVFGGGDRRYYETKLKHLHELGLATHITEL